MVKFSDKGSGWFAQTGRHRNAKKFGVAGGQYSAPTRSKKLRKLTYGQLKKKGVKLSPKGDADHDGVVNKRDCRPFNPKMQDETEIYHNPNDKVADQYTVIINGQVFTMDDHPNRPDGYNQYVGEERELNKDAIRSGKRVEFDSLPEEIRKAVIDRGYNPQKQKDDDLITNSSGITWHKNPKVPKTLKGKTILIKGRRWFERVNGNTYHSAQVYVDNELIGEVPFTYGYGDGYQQSGIELLRKSGKAGNLTDMDIRHLKMDGKLNIMYDVSDVQRKKDL